MKFDVRAVFGNLSRKFVFHYNFTRVTFTVHEDVYTFVVMSRSVLIRMRNILDRSRRENKNTRFKHFFPKSVGFMG